MKFLLVVSIVVLLSGCVSEVSQEQPQDHGVVEAYFCPKDNCGFRVVSAIDHADD